VYMDLVYLHCGPNNVLKDIFPDAFQKNPDGTVRTTKWHFPYVNFESKGVRKYLIDSMLHWMRLGCDGFRCDVGDEVPIDFWVEAVTACQKVNPELVMINEGRKPEWLEKAFDACYDWPWSFSIRHFPTPSLPGQVNAKNKSLDKKMPGVRDYEAKIPDGALMFVFMDNHDTAADDWENRFDPAQLEIFLNCYEEVINAMLEERSARRLKKHISEEYFPKHFFTTAGELNAEAGFELIPDKAEKDRVKIYVLDERFNKKPFGGWGRLYISGVRPSQAVDEIANPFRPGSLFDTGIEARILPDGRIDFLENSGRIVLTDGAHGRRYYDLGILEKTLDGVQHVDAVHAYLAYSTDINEMKLGMDVEVAKDSFINRLRTAAGASLGEQMIPAVVNLTSR